MISFGNTSVLRSSYIVHLPIPFLVIKLLSIGINLTESLNIRKEFYYKKMDTSNSLERAHWLDFA